MTRARLALPIAVLTAACGLAAQEPAPPPEADAFQLGLVLQAARRYCARLEKAALDFVCFEEVSEVLDPGRDRRGPAVTPSPEGSENSGTSSSGSFAGGGNSGRQLRFEDRPGGRFNNTYVYDYQFIRREGKVEERRALLERNGKKAGPGSGRAPMLAFNFADILLAPVQVLDARFEEFYAYRLLGRDKLDGTEAWVLEVAPRLTGVSRYLGGKIWLKADDASVLRIEWDPATFGSYENVLSRAGAYGAEPAVRSWTEFGVEKNGLRFPSLDVTEEAYRDARGKVFVRCRTSVRYRDHKFFTVETRTDYKK